jgi:hypothetical protein
VEEKEMGVVEVRVRLMTRGCLPWLDEKKNEPPPTNFSLKLWRKRHQKSIFSIFDHAAINFDDGTKKFLSRRLNQVSQESGTKKVFQNHDSG